jgi:tetratricopeptide (TPR) repeat protein
MNPMNPNSGKEVAKRPHSTDMDSTLPPGADAEERFNEFWKQNGSSIFVAIVLGAIVVIGVQTWRYVKERREAGIQAAYSVADTSEKLLTFAKDHPSHRLAGAAYLQLANDEYASGKYKEAKEYYSLAHEKLAGTPFSERAGLGAAMSTLLSGDTQNGLTELRAILDNPELLEITRAEAGFNLAVYYLQKEDYKTLSGIIDIADTFGEKNIYADFTRRMRNRIPEQK